MKCRRCNTERVVTGESKKEYSPGRIVHNYIRERGICPKCGNVRLTTWECTGWHETGFTSASQPDG